MHKDSWARNGSMIPVYGELHQNWQCCMIRSVAEDNSDLDLELLEDCGEDHRLD
jgi:hypothetical protein